MPDSKQQVIATIIAVIIILLFLGVLFVLMLVYYRNRKKQITKEKENLQLLFQQQLVLAQTEVQESTLTSLSKELHDNIGQLLGTAKILLGVAQRNPETRTDTLITAEQTLGTAIQELRTLSKTLNKDWLERFSFFDNLHTEIGRINATQQHQVILNNTIAEIPFNAQQQLIIFRIVQEALNNACRHGKAGTINIHTQLSNDLLNIKIADNGKGFDNVAKNRGMGLSNMQHRADLLKGSLNIDTGKKGTTVTLILPTEYAL